MPPFAAMRRPLCRCCRLLVDLLLVVLNKESRCVIRRIEPEHGQMDYPDAVKVSKQMKPRPCLLVCLEEALLPVDFTKLEVSLSGSQVNQQPIKSMTVAYESFIPSS